MKTFRLRAAIAATAIALATAIGVDAQAIDTRQAIFNPTFKTLTVTAADNFMGMPVVRLGTTDRLIISFDEITEDYRYLQYRILHCNADWQPSRLMESEYLDSFNIGEITDYAFSSNTFVHYVNYHLEIPNDDMQPLVSGNYLLQVFEQENPDDVILQVRFGVSEEAVSIAGNASGRTDRGFNTEWQQLSLTVASTGFKIENPYQDLIIEITQNQRPQTTRRLTHPMRVDGNRVVYEHSPELIFPASNEFRRFETVRTNDPGMHVDSLRWGGSNIHAYLHPDERRADRSYSFDRTQHGRFLVRESNATDSDLGADYMTVNFTLNHPEIIDGDIHVDGELTGWTPNESNRMVYDRTSGLYTLSLPLKQGSYNYQYVVTPKGKKGDATPAPVEGNHYETGNEYNIKVYYRPAGARADRLIGHGIINSN